MYDKKYAEAWIKNDESGKDIFRVKYLDPFLKKYFQNLPKDTKILDVGCGWATVLQYVKSNQEYIEIDVTTDFFKYVRNKYSHLPIVLKKGSLPKNIDAKDGYFDIAICSMTFHTVADLNESIKTCLQKLKSGGKLLIVDFNNKAEDACLGDKSSEYKIQKSGYLKGLVNLPSDIIVEAEIFFHKENDFEKILAKYANYKKEYLGPLFVSYSCITNI